MFVTLSGMVMPVKVAQPENAPSAILVKLDEIVILVSELQQLKAADPMLVTLSGMAMSVSELQSEKEDPQMSNHLMRQCSSRQALRE